MNRIKLSKYKSLKKIKTTRCFYLVGVFMLFACISMVSCNTPYFTKNEKIYVQQNKNTVETFITYQQVKKVKEDKIYYWYKKRHINKSVGVYAGNLLNGPYIEFNENRIIVKKGAFKKGLKHNIWKTWFEDGTLKSSIEWKYGIKNGVSFFYNEQGELISEVKYKKGIEIIKPIEVKNDSI